MSKKNFALIGAAGYIAPRHMKTIKETGNKNYVHEMRYKEPLGMKGEYSSYANKSLTKHPLRK